MVTDFADLSSNNGPINWQAYKAAGHNLVVIKATEGTTYTWPGYQTAVRAAHAAGLQVFAYDFDRTLGDAGHFLAACASAGVMNLLTGIILDFEATATAADATAFMEVVEQAKTGKLLWVYAGAYKIQDTGLAYRRGWDWWVPAYTPAMPDAPRGWPAPVAWQYTQSATAPWISGQVDLSHLLKPLAPTPAPVPTIQEDDMTSLITAASGPGHGHAYASDGLFYRAVPMGDGITDGVKADWWPDGAVHEIGGDTFSTLIDANTLAEQISQLTTDVAAIKKSLAAPPASKD